MRCRRVRALFSELRDGDLAGSMRSAMAAHLQACAACADRWQSLVSALDALAGSPRVEPLDSLVPRVLSRLEVERRGPGLALLFRPVLASRPLIMPSLAAAAAFVISVISLALLLDGRPDPLPEVYVRPGSPGWAALVAPLGSERNPLSPSSNVEGPVARDGATLPPEVLAELAELGEGTFFLHTVVARDGTVSDVTLIGGDAAMAEELMDALRRERFVPARYRGQPVAVSQYRLISRMDVRPPQT